MFKFPENILSDWQRAKEFTVEIGCFLQGIGWTTRKARIKHASECTLYISPCRKFLVKRPFVTNTSLPPNAIPTIVENGWFLQPIADVSAAAKKEAYKYFKVVQKYYEHDMNRNNVALFDGNPVLIDW